MNMDCVWEDFNGEVRCPQCKPVQRLRTRRNCGARRTGREGVARADPAAAPSGDDLRTVILEVLQADAKQPIPGLTLGELIEEVQLRCRQCSSGIQTVILQMRKEGAIVERTTSAGGIYSSLARLVGPIDFRT